MRTKAKRVLQRPQDSQVDTVAETFMLDFDAMQK
jgi:hypothetical protein